MPITSQRAAFLYRALSLMYPPSRYGAKGERAANGAQFFDCSVLVTWCLHQVGGPDWRTTHNMDWASDVCLHLPTSGTL